MKAAPPYFQRISPATLSLAALAVIGFALRIFHLADNSLWIDEAITVRLVQKSLPAILNEHWNTNPPLYFLVLKAWIPLFGKTEFSLRFPSVIFGTGTILLTRMLGASLFDRKTGLLAALFIAIMVFPVHYSREARNYSLFLFATTGSFYYFHRWLCDHARNNGIGYVLFSVAIIYSHNYSVFTLVSQNLFVTIFYWKQKGVMWRWLLLQGLVFFLVLPWLLLLVAKTETVLQGGFWIPRSDLNYLLVTFRSYLAFLLGPYIVWGYLILIGVGLCEPLLARRTQITKETSIPTYPHAMLLLWLTCTIMLPFILSRFLVPIFFVRFTIGALPAIYILLSRGVLFSQEKIIRSAIICVIVLASSASLYNYYAYRPRPDLSRTGYFIFPQDRWREFLSNIAAEDVVLIERRGYLNVLKYYRKLQLAHPLSIFVADNNAKTLSRLKPVIRKKSRLWIIFSSDLDSRERSLIQAIGKRFERLETESVVRPAWDANMFLFDLTKPRKRPGTRNR